MTIIKCERCLGEGWDEDFLKCGDCDGRGLIDDGESREFDYDYEPVHNSAMREATDGRAK